MTWGLEALVRRRRGSPAALAETDKFVSSCAQRGNWAGSLRSSQPPRCTWRYIRNQLGGSVSGALLLDRRQGCGPERGGHTLVRDSLAHRNVGPVRQPAADTTLLHVAVVARATTQFRVVPRKPHLGPCPAVRPRRPLFRVLLSGWATSEPTAPFLNRLVGMASAERANPKFRDCSASCRTPEGYPDTSRRAGW